MTDAFGQETTEDVRDADSPVSLSLVKRDGKWYVTDSPFL
jgi:hypothetical protein